MEFGGRVNRLVACKISGDLFNGVIDVLDKVGAASRALGLHRMFFRWL